MCATPTPNTNIETCPRCHQSYDYYRGYRMLCANCNPLQYREQHMASIDLAEQAEPKE